MPAGDDGQLVTSAGHILMTSGPILWGLRCVWYAHRLVRDLRRPCVGKPTHRWRWMHLAEGRHPATRIQLGHPVRPLCIGTWRSWALERDLHGAAQIQAWQAPDLLGQAADEPIVISLLGAMDALGDAPRNAGPWWDMPLVIDLTGDDGGEDVDNFGEPGKRRRLLSYAEVLRLQQVHRRAAAAARQPCSVTQPQRS